MCSFRGTIFFVDRWPVFLVLAMCTSQYQTNWLWQRHIHTFRNTPCRSLKRSRPCRVHRNAPNSHNASIDKWFAIRRNRIIRARVSNLKAWPYPSNVGECLQALRSKHDRVLCESQVYAMWKRKGLWKCQIPFLFDTSVKHDALAPPDRHNRTNCPHGKWV